ncbi:Thiol reductant ABC exporter subunit CydC [Bordetella sputigena]|uniref:ATP-binding cassette domain-containing protein n=1 Tax=Bordetella sputigena TaxID=1416810 RepID=UPI0039F0DFB4
MKMSFPFLPDLPARIPAPEATRVPRRSTIGRFIRTQARLRRADLALAATSGAIAASAATLLLGLSGWFLAGAALAGSAGPAAVQAFNYLLPSAGMRGLAILRTAGRYGERLFGHRAAFAALAELRPLLFAGIAATPPHKALALSTGEASARLVQDVDAVEAAFVRRPAPWVAAAAAGAALSVLALASPWAPAAYAIGMGIQLAVGRRLARRWCGDAGRDALRATGSLKDAVGAYLPAAAELRCFGLTAGAVDAVMARDAELGAAILRRNHAQADLAAIHAGITGATLLAIAALSAGAALPLLALAVLATLAAMEGTAPLLRAAQQHGALQEACARLDEAMDRDAPDTPHDHPTLAPGAAATLRIGGSVFPAGSRVGIAGPSGSGKTAMLEALLGLRAASPGYYAVNGTALENHPIGWARPCFAYVPQDPSPLTGTVADNLRLGAPLADDTALWQALADACLATRIRAMPHGLQTWLGDGGLALSGGECRRLALARALLRPAPWLVLDEPTEGLDAGTERQVIEALERRLRLTGQGLLLVSHRPAPLRLCRARIEAQGSASSHH